MENAKTENTEKKHREEELQKKSEEIIAAAKAEADKILAEAGRKAADIESESKNHIDRLKTDIAELKEGLDFGMRETEKQKKILDRLKSEVSRKSDKEHDSALTGKYPVEKTTIVTGNKRKIKTVALIKSKNGSIKRRLISVKKA